MTIAGSGCGAIMMSRVSAVRAVSLTAFCGRMAAPPFGGVERARQLCIGIGWKTQKPSTATAAPPGSCGWTTPREEEFVSGPMLFLMVAIAVLFLGVAQMPSNPLTLRGGLVVLAVILSGVVVLTALLTYPG